jgi:hypothetical protein
MWDGVMAREVSLTELNEWLAKNLQRTWAWEPGLTDKTIFDAPKPHTKEIKYMNFALDTRDGRIFHITINGSGPDQAVDFRDDEKDWSLLDLLDSKLRPLG